MNKYDSIIISKIAEAKKSKSKKLDLRTLKTDSLPDELFELEHLESLYLFACDLKELPEKVGKLHNLKEILLHDNNFVTFPEGLRNLKKLETIWLNGNKISYIPKWIGELKSNLKRLFLEKNQIIELPDALFELKNLEMLFLNDNRISNIPKSIKSIKNIKKLFLHNNDLSNLPYEILELDLISENRELEREANFNIKNNPFGVSDHIFTLTPKEQVNYLLNLQIEKEKGNTKPLNEAKVIFIGDSSVGKTHLIEFLINGKLTREINTTHGIERNQIKVGPSDSIKLNIWDLGGQKFMRNTHQFFFTERTLYVLVTLARTERDGINYWLKLIQQLGGENVPTIIVTNQIDKDPHKQSENEILRDYPNVKDFLYTSISNGYENTIIELKRKIESIVLDKDLMELVFELKTDNWFKIKQRLEEKHKEEKRDFISYNEYENICNEEVLGMTEYERNLTLKTLNAIGVVVSFIDDKRLSDTNVLNPQWVLDGVYSIINNPTIKDEKKGHFTEDDLNQILPSNKYHQSKHHYLIDLMRKFKLCYPINNKFKNYLIPSLFEDIEPDFSTISLFTWKVEECIRFRFDYHDYPPTLIITQFIVEKYTEIYKDIRWRSGVYLETEKGCIAKVYLGFRENYINIEIKSENKATSLRYLSILESNLNSLHKVNNLNPKREIYYDNIWYDYDDLLNYERLGFKEKPVLETGKIVNIQEILSGYSYINPLKNYNLTLFSDSNLNYFLNMGGDTYNNSGISGAMGPDAKVENNTFNQFQILPNDFSSVYKLLKENGVFEDDIQELKSIVENEKPNEDKKTFGEKTNAWISKMISKSLDGSWAIGIGAAGKLLADAIKAYYGWH